MQSFIGPSSMTPKILRGLGDPKPLVASQFPQKVSIQIALHPGKKIEGNKAGVRCLGMLPF